MNAQVLDGFVEDGALDFAVHEKLVQRGQRNENANRLRRTRATRRGPSLRPKPSVPK